MTNDTVLECKDVSESYKDILKDSNLVIRIIDEVHNEFYGEEDTIMALIVSINTRLVKDCKPESRNIVVSELSGAGKDRLVKALCEVMLEDEVTYFHRSKLTPEVFTYWHTNEEDWTWDGKVIHVEDPQPDLLDCQGFKTMASGEKSATVVDKQKAKDLKVEGKPNLIITSYEGCANIEGVRRYPFVHLNTSEELTKTVLRGISKKYSGELHFTKNKTLRESLRQLHPFKVIIPFAEELIEYFPNSLVVRTYYPRFLDYIASSTVLHQYQREIDDDGNLLATWDDYDLGRITFLKTVNDITMLPLNREQENLLDILKKSGKNMFVSDIHKQIAKGRDWIYRNLETLKRYDIVEQDTQYKEDANKSVACYRYNGNRLSGLSLPIRQPPTGRLYGCSGFLRNIDEKRESKGLSRLYDKYCYISNTTNNTIQPLEKQNRQPPDNHPTTTFDDVIKSFGGKRESDILTPTQRWVQKMLKKSSSGNITPEEKAKLQKFVKKVTRGNS